MCRVRGLRASWGAWTIDPNLQLRNRINTQVKCDTCVTQASCGPGVGGPIPENPQIRNPVNSRTIPENPQIRNPGNTRVSQVLADLPFLGFGRFWQACRFWQNSAAWRTCAEARRSEPVSRVTVRRMRREQIGRMRPFQAPGEVRNALHTSGRVQAGEFLKSLQVFGNGTGAETEQVDEKPALTLEDVEPLRHRRVRVGVSDIGQVLAQEPTPAWVLAW